MAERKRPSIFGSIFGSGCAESEDGAAPALIDISGPFDGGNCGGKGQKLGEMVRLGLPVPPFVIVPTDVCASLLYQDSGSSVVRALIDSVLKGEGGEAELQKIQEAILQLTIPDAVVQELEAFLKSLPKGSAVSCRSSATGGRR